MPADNRDRVREVRKFAYNFVRNHPTINPIHEAIVVTCIVVMTGAALVAMTFQFVIGDVSRVAWPVCAVTVAGILILTAADLWFRRRS